MARIAGVNIPSEKRIEIALRYIHGIGPAKSAQICSALKLKKKEMKTVNLNLYMIFAAEYHKKH